MATFTITTPTTTSLAITAGTGTMQQLFIDIGVANTGASGGAAGGSIVVGSDGNTYYCILAHTSATANDKPITGTNYATYWVLAETGAAAGAPNWANATAYASSPIWRTGANPYTYAVQLNRQLNLTACTLNLSNSGDSLTWTPSSTTIVLYVNTGATLTATTNVTFDFNTANNTTQGNVYLFGNTTFAGTDGNEVHLKHMYHLYTYFCAASAFDWDYVHVEDNRNGYIFYVNENAGNEVGQNTSSANFNYVTVSNPTNDNYGTLYLSSLQSGAVWTNCTFDNMSRLQFLYTTVKFVSCTFSHTYTATSILTDQSGLSLGIGHYTTSKTKLYASDTQPKITFDTCTFHQNDDSGANSKCFNGVRYGAMVKFKDCTFSGASAGTPATAGVYASAGIALYQGTTTFTNVTTNRVWSSNGTHLHVRALALTVVDNNGVAIANASVTVRQLENKESWEFITNASGLIKDCFVDDPVFVEKEETSTSTYTQWSDGSSAVKKHRIMVSKHGYQTWIRDVAFTADQTITAALRTEGFGFTLPIQGA